VVRAAFANDGTDKQTVFAVLSDMIPAITLKAIVGIVEVEVLLLLANEGPFFVPSKGE
jgi:hypothetical protein